MPEIYDGTSLLRKAEKGGGSPGEKAAIEAIHFLQAAMGTGAVDADAPAQSSTPGTGDTATDTPRRVG